MARLPVDPEQQLKLAGGANPSTIYVADNGVAMTSPPRPVVPQSTMDATMRNIGGLKNPPTTYTAPKVIDITPPPTGGTPSVNVLPSGESITIAQPGVPAVRPTAGPAVGVSERGFTMGPGSVGGVKPGVVPPITPAPSTPLQISYKPPVTPYVEGMGDLGTAMGETAASTGAKIGARGLVRGALGTVGRVMANPVVAAPMMLEPLATATAAAAKESGQYTQEAPTQVPQVSGMNLHNLPANTSLFGDPNKSFSTMGIHNQKGMFDRTPVQLQTSKNFNAYPSTTPAADDPNYYNSGRGGTASDAMAKDNAYADTAEKLRQQFIAAEQDTTPPETPGITPGTGYIDVPGQGRVSLGSDGKIAFSGGLKPSNGSGVVAGQGVNSNALIDQIIANRQSGYGGAADTSTPTATPAQTFEAWKASIPGSSGMDNGALLQMYNAQILPHQIQQGDLAVKQGELGLKQRALPVELGEKSAASNYYAAHANYMNANADQLKWLKSPAGLKYQSDLRTEQLVAAAEAKKQEKQSELDKKLEDAKVAQAVTDSQSLGIPLEDALTLQAGGGHVGKIRDSGFLGLSNRPAMLKGGKELTIAARGTDKQGNKFVKYSDGTIAQVR